MHIGKASAYAILAVHRLACMVDQRPMQGREIAAECGIPLDYLLKILQQLSKSRIVTSSRGRSGGFQLHRSPRQISVLDIIEAIDGPIDADIPIEPTSAAGRHAHQLLLGLCGQIAAHTRLHMSQTTIQDLMGPE